jgi:ABC-2 type transport system ATP-binding protein
MSENVVETTGVVKRYGDFTAVDHLTFAIPRGSIFGLLGPNGAGKTSAIRMIMKIMLPDEGDIRVLGDPLDRLDTDRIGYLPEERGLYKKMKVLDLLTFFGQIKSVPRANARARGAEWLERLGLGDYAEKTPEDLSKGMQQKVQFISTVIHEPELIILDEPFSGLDPVNANVLKDIMLDYHDRGHTVIFSTHMMEQVEKLCDTICLINRGALVMEGRLADVKRQYGRNGVTLRFSGDGSFLASLPEVESVNDYGNEVFLRLREDASPAHILEAASGRVDVQKFEVAEPSVHDIFIELVSEKPQK